MPIQTKRYSIVGCSGSGKSTLARRLAKQAGLPLLELDSIYHQPGWVPLEEEAFRRSVLEFMDLHEGWVIDGNYQAVRSLVWERASDVVWIHPPLARVMLQITMRTLKRQLRREVLWNGNRETLSNLYSMNPERSVIAWSLKTYSRYGLEYEALLAESEAGGFDAHVLRSRKDVEEWFHRLHLVDCSKGAVTHHRSEDDSLGPS